MKLIALCIFALVSAGGASRATMPKFPSVWWSDYAAKVAIFQGGTYNQSSGEACCSLVSPGCKVQAEGQLGTQYVDGENNQTAVSAEGQTIISQYGSSDNGKEYLVTPAKSGDGWTCQSFCPLEESWYPPLGFDKSATDLGKVNIKGKTYDHWQWYDKIFKTITMDVQDWFVDNSNPSKPKPAFQNELLTPFGGPELGFSSQQFENFEEGLDKFNFKVSGVEKCEENDNCGDDAHKRRRRRSRMMLGSPGGSKKLDDLIGSFLKRKTKGLAKFSEKAKHESSLSSIWGKKTWREENKRYTERQSKQKSSGIKSNLTESKWPGDWSGEVTNSLLINQGGHKNKAGDAMCCDTSSNVQCEIQAEYQSGMLYYDFTNQRQRMEDPVNGVTVGFFSKDGKKPGKNMLVEHNGTHDVCVKYCPIDPAESMDGGRDQFIDPNATNMGKVTWKGKEAIHWQWNNTIFGVITMETTDFYITTDYVPIEAFQKLTPFGGPAIGGFHNMWSKFKPGPQPANKFDIHGVDDCPQDPQCGEQKYN